MNKFNNARGQLAATSIRPNARITRPQKRKPSHINVNSGFAVPKLAKGLLVFTGISATVLTASYLSKKNTENNKQNEEDRDYLDEEEEEDHEKEVDHEEDELNDMEMGPIPEVSEETKQLEKTQDMLKRRENFKLELPIMCSEKI